MSRFHFNVYDGAYLPDKDGAELLDIDEARREAMRSAAVMIEDAAERAEPCDEWQMEVTDYRGLVLFRLDFIITRSAALKSAN